MPYKLNDTDEWQKILKQPISVVPNIQEYAYETWPEAVRIGGLVRHRFEIRSDIQNWQWLCRILCGNKHPDGNDPEFASMSVLGCRATSEYKPWSLKGEDYLEIPLKITTSRSPRMFIYKNASNLNQSWRMNRPKSTLRSGNVEMYHTLTR